MPLDNFDFKGIGKCLSIAMDEIDDEINPVLIIENNKNLIITYLKLFDVDKITLCKKYLN